MSYFRTYSTSVHPIWSEVGRGLRVAQLGALWSLASQFTISKGPVQAVLPTGTGKTAVMTLLPFLIPTDRVLVLTPSRLVRDQVVNEFQSLSVLRSTGSCDPHLSPPSVRKLEHRVRDWSEYREFDVVVGTPSVVSSAYPDVAAIPTGFFDLVIVDEAHHAPAPTWETVLGQLENVRTVLLTATPFRRDRRGLPGEIAYEYPVGQAIRDGIYQPIDFVPVTVLPGQDRDACIAAVVASRLATQIHVEARTAAIIRTDRIDEAERLVEVYQAVGVQIGVIHSRQSLRTAQRTLNQLAEGGLVGVASVGVLGEGFDLPTLKIAAYHRRHKSLPATLQFVGRIARVGAGIERPPAELVAVREEVQDETRVLYANDKSWAEMLPAIAESAVAQERERRIYLRQLVPSDDAALSPYAIQPRLQAEVFSMPSDRDVSLSLNGDSLGSGTVIQSYLDDQGDLLAVVTQRRIRPSWLRSDAYDGYEYSLHLAVKDRVRRLLFVSSGAVEALLAAIDAREAPRVPASAMNRFLNGLDILSYSSIGMRNARAPSPHEATYRMIASSAAERAVRQSESRAYGIGHLIGRHRDEDGAVHAVGVSVAKRKVWSPESGDLLAYKAWCLQVGALMQATGAITSRAPLLDLQIPEDLRDFQSAPIVALLHWQLLQGNAYLETSPTERSDLADAVLIPEAVDLTHYRIRLYMNDAEVWCCKIDIHGRVAAETNDLSLWVDSEQWTLTAAFEEWEISSYFADGSTVNGSVRYPGYAELPPVPSETLLSQDWGAVDIQRESRPGRNGKINVQTATAQWLRANSNPALLINDDGANELADLVSLSGIGQERLEVDLVHCKWSSESQPGLRLGDVHDVVCQAVRSARWAGSASFLDRLSYRFNRGGNTQVIDGDQERSSEIIRELLERRPSITFRIIIVQPGLRIEGVSGHPAIKSLLVNAIEWVRSQGADLIVLGS